MFVLRFLVIWTLHLAPAGNRALLTDDVTLRNSIQNWTFRAPGTPSPSFPHLKRSIMTEKKHTEPINCFCDDLCPAYNDCCPVFTPDVNRSTSVVQLPAEVVTCLRFRSNSGSDHSAVDEDIYVVSRCPNSFEVDYVREGCALSESSLEPFYRLPVNGNLSRILYGNVYCAICNGEPEVIYWTVRQELSQGSPGSELLPKTSNDTDGRFVFLNPEGQKMRGCQKLRNVTPTPRCRSNVSSQTKTGKCPDRPELLSLHISYEFLDLDLIHSQPLPVCEVNRSQYGRTINRGVDPDPVSRSLTSYSIIFDLNSKSIQATENKLKGDPNARTRSISMPNCGQGMLYDPFSASCRQIYCTSGFKLSHGGACMLVHIANDLEQRHPAQPNVSHNESLNCSQLIRLNGSEFTMLSNDSAFVYQLGASYRPEEYLHDPPYLYICSNFIQEIRNETVDNVPAFHFDRVQSIASFVGILISLVALLIQFIIYMVFPVLRNTPGKCVVCLILSIFSGQLSFLFVAFTGPVCRYLAAFIHFAILSSFCWTNVLALDISKTFSCRIATTRPRSGSRRFLIYSVYAWIVPAIIVGICLVMDVLKLDVNFRPHYGEGVCWITSRMGLVLFFLVPVAVILASNFVLFGITVFCLRRSSRASETAIEKSRSKSQLILYFRLSVIMGLTWAFGFIATLTQSAAMWYLFILFNTLQGAFLCLAFVFTRNVLQLMKRGTPLLSRGSLSSKNRTRETSCPVRDFSPRKT